MQSAQSGLAATSARPTAAARDASRATGAAPMPATRLSNARAANVPVAIRAIKTKRLTGRRWRA
jgi:hypothetical protein